MGLGNFKKKKLLVEYPYQMVLKWVTLGDGSRVQRQVKVYDPPPKGLESRANSVAFSRFAVGGNVWVRYGASV